MDGYGYQELLTDLRRLSMRHRFLQTGFIGRSVLGQPIPYVRIGTGPRQVHYNGSCHAQEWITTPYLMRFLETYAGGVAAGEERAQRLFQESSLWLVPMVNPDGVELVLNRISPENPCYEEALRANGGSSDFRPWAANIRGVDLNKQFPAGWEAERRKGKQGPAPRGYAGPAPLSEPEAAALAALTREVEPCLVIAVHTQGEVIYWGYAGLEPPESEAIVKRFARVSGYQPIRYAGTGAGYKDWFIQEYRRPGFTLELGRGVNPLPFGQFELIWRKAGPILWEGLEV